MDPENIRGGRDEGEVRRRDAGRPQFAPEGGRLLRGVAGDDEVLFRAREVGVGGVDGAVHGADEGPTMGDILFDFVWLGF